MLDLQLREEFRGKRLKSTTVDFKNQSGTGALDITAADFLKITYPSHYLLKTIEATGPGHSRPVVLLGARGQGKSHLKAALYHLCHDPDAGSAWLSEWAAHLKNSQIADLKLDDKLKEIAKTLGKVDEHGEVAEDLRSQILGQLWTTTVNASRRGRSKPTVSLSFNPPQQTPNHKPTC